MSVQCALYKAPKNQTEANNLAADLTQKYGSQGWSLVSTVALPGSFLLFSFQK